jgi:hypothetical protein
LRSHLVIITGYQEPESFLEAAQRQLEQLGIQGNLRILTNADGTPKRKTIKVKQSTKVGFGLDVTRLSDEDSLMGRNLSHYQLMEERLLLSTREQSFTLISILLNISATKRGNCCKKRLVW